MSLCNCPDNSQHLVISNRLVLAFLNDDFEAYDFTTNEVDPKCWPKIATCLAHNVAYHLKSALGHDGALTRIQDYLAAWLGKG